ncbi:MAG: DASS family sodium-coupled anion symporter, partial [Sporomusa sp.]
MTFSNVFTKINSKTMQLLICVAVAVLLLLCPPPSGLSAEAWKIFAIYLATIFGLVLKPYPEPVILVIALAALGVLLQKQAVFMTGFSISASWLILTAFMIGSTFHKTGLGARLAYLLMRKLGRTVLGLGYVAAFTDLVLAPAIPSNIARTGAVITPVYESIATSLGSFPTENRRRCGAYFMVLLFAITNTTGTIFLTGTSMNPLLLNFAEQILNVKITWISWLQAAIMPGLVILLVLPWLFNKLYPSELSAIDNVKLADEALAKLGPISRQEKILAALFSMAVFAWLTGSITKIDASTVALAFLGGSILTGLLSWEDCLNAKSGWSTFFWYSGIMGISAALAKANFFDWLASMVLKGVNFDGINQIVIMGAILLFSIVIRYVFASGGSYVASMIPVLFTIAAAADLPALPIAFLLFFSASFASCLTHYTGAVGVVLFGFGYNTKKEFWGLGAVLSIFCFVV